MENNEDLDIDMETLVNVFRIELGKLRDENINLKVANVQLQKNNAALREQLQAQMSNSSKSVQLSERATSEAGI